MTLRQRIARMLDPRTVEVGPKALLLDAFVRRYTCPVCSGHGFDVAPIPELHPYRIKCKGCGARMRPDTDIMDVVYPVMIDAGIMERAVKESNAS